MAHAYNDLQFKGLVEQIEETTLHICDLDWEVAIENSDTFDEFMEEMEELIRQHEIIYYGRAMDYLMEHDYSLHESLGIAAEFGYDAASLNSELLATLLWQQNAMNELHTLDDYSENFEQVAA